jgi:hypothetical protein
VLLLPALLGAIDGLARVRRRKQPVAVWLRWLLAGAVPFLLTALAARLIGLTGAVPPLAGAVDPAALPPDAAVLAVLGLVLVLGFLVRGPVARALGARSAPRSEDVPGAAAAVVLVLVAVAVAVWAVNPYTALLLVPAVHLALIAAVPDTRPRRVVGVLLVALGLLPLALVALHYASAFDLDAAELAWMGVVALAGGTAGPLGVVAWSLLLSGLVGAALVTARKRVERAEPPPDAPIRLRGPLSYAGPGSLGGTESALRR